MPGIFRAASVVILGGVLVAGSASMAAQQPAVEKRVPIQPLAQQARRVETALRYLGEPLAAADVQALNDAIAGSKVLELSYYKENEDQFTDR